MEGAAGPDEADSRRFYCNICNISCGCAMNLQSHFLGLGHRQAEWLLRNQGDKQVPVAKQVPKKPVETLDDQLNACKATEPAVGLEYIYEYQKGTRRAYVCKLCGRRLPCAHMFLHITGAKHRVNYLNKHHSELGIPKTYTVSGQKKLNQLKETCMVVEKKFGRKNINIIILGKTEKFPQDSEIEVDPSSIDSGPDSKQQNIDVTVEDFSGTDCEAQECKPKSPEHVLTFLEIKAAHEADMVNAAACGSLSEDIVDTPESDHDNEEITGDGEKEGNNGNDKEVCGMELANRYPVEFTNNKEIIDFLGSYKVCEEDDISFLLKVIGKLGSALVQYKKHCEEMEKKRRAKSKHSDEEKMHMNLHKLPSLKRTHADQETSTNSQLQVSHSTNQPTSAFPTHSSVEMLPETTTNCQIQVPDSTTQSTSFPTHSTGEMHPDSITTDDQSQKFPAFKVNGKTPTNASSPDRLQESKTPNKQKEIFSCVAESSFRPDSTQDSATKGNESTKYPAIHNKAPTRATTSGRPQDCGTKRNQRAEYPAFKAGNKAPTSDRPQDSATRCNQRAEYPAFKVDDKTPSRGQTSDRPQESLNRYNQNHKFPMSSWYGNKEHHFGSHTSSLPASTKPLQRNQQSFSSLTLNRGAPTRQATHPFTSGHSQHMSQHQQFDSMSQPKKTGSAPPRAPFPHELLKQTAP